MKRIWAVTEGSYNDYHVNFVTESKRLAEQAVDIGAGDSFEEMAILDSLPEKVVVQKAQAWVDPDGSPCTHHRYGRSADQEVSAWSFTQWSFEDYGGATPRPKVKTWTCGCGKRCTGIEAISTSSNASVKACADRLGQIKAERQGVAV